MNERGHEAGGSQPGIELKVPPESTATLAALVREALRCSHRQAKEAVQAGRVWAGGKPRFDPAFRPHPGTELQIVEQGVPRSKRPWEGPGFRIVYSDDLFLVVEKEAGIVTIPTAKDDPDDLPLVARLGALLVDAGHRARDLWVVHRIDRETSGLVLFARSEAASRRLKRQFLERLPLREYLAWTEGIPAPPQGRLVHHLLEEERSRRVLVARPSEQTKEAALTYTVEAQNPADPPRARVRVRLISGRRNQIRVQFSASGWPLLGDTFYGATDPGPGRTALHAARLGFIHPATGQELVFESPLPDDLRKLDRRLFGRAKS